MLAEELRRLGRTFRKPGFLKDRRDIGVRGEALPARLVPVEDRPNRSLSFGSRKTCAPLEPCCFRFSAPWLRRYSRSGRNPRSSRLQGPSLSSSVGPCRQRSDGAPHRIAVGLVRPLAPQIARAIAAHSSAWKRSSHAVGEGDAPGRPDDGWSAQGCKCPPRKRTTAVHAPKPDRNDVLRRLDQPTACGDDRPTWRSIRTDGCISPSLVRRGCWPHNADWCVGQPGRLPRPKRTSTRQAQGRSRRPGTGLRRVSVVCGCPIRPPRDSTARPGDWR